MKDKSMADKSIVPFVKWAGGKGQLLERIKAKVPKEFNTYYEPFIGGGAVFLDLKPKKAVINDINEQLINIYKQLQIEPQSIINIVNKLDEVICDKDYYLLQRENYNKKITNHELDAECAALMIWINKHCFNGLYRVNGKGLFNVPFNNKKSGKSINEENLINIENYLAGANVQIICGDFEKACEGVEKGDFVYFDSPYVPISQTASFTDYTKDGFLLDDHKRLAELFKNLDKRGAKLMLSNNDVELVHELYNGYCFECFDVKRFINSDASKRTGREVIITNYECN